MLVKKSSNSKFSGLLILIRHGLMHSVVHPGVFVAKDTLTSTRILASLTFSYLAPANHHFPFLLRHADGCGVVTKSWSLHMTFV